MALIKCKNCGKEISKKASICPNCGIKVHPVKDIVKMVIVVLVVNFTLVFGLFVLSGGLAEVIQKAKEERPVKKFYGTWELVSYNDNAKEDNLYDKIEIEKFTGGMHKYWYIEDKDNIQVFIGDDIVACFSLDHEYLVQEDCEGFSAGYEIIEGRELKYQKVK